MKLWWFKFWAILLFRGPIYAGRYLDKKKEERHGQ